MHNLKIPYGLQIMRSKECSWICHFSMWRVCYGLFRLLWESTFSMIIGRQSSIFIQVGEANAPTYGTPPYKGSPTKWSRPRKLSDHRNSWQEKNFDREVIGAWKNPQNIVKNPLWFKGTVATVGTGTVPLGTFLLKSKSTQSNLLYRDCTGMRFLKLGVFHQTTPPGPIRGLREQFLILLIFHGAIPILKLLPGVQDSGESIRNNEVRRIFKTWVKCICSESK